MERRVLTLKNRTLADDSRRISAASENATAIFADTIKKAYFRRITDVAWGTVGALLVTGGFSQQVWDDMVMNQVRSYMNDRLFDAIFGTAMTGYQQGQFYTPDFRTPAEAENYLVPWSQQYAAQLTNDTVAQSDQAVRDSLGRYLVKGLAPETTGARIRAIFGLDPRSAIGVDNYRDGLAKANVPGGFIGKMVLDYATKSFRRRTELIGRTESMVSLNFGRQILFDQAIARGDLPAGTAKTWVTALDERVCPTCAPMDGQTVPFKESFMLPNMRLMVPPAHPRCRCLIVPSSYVRQGIITRTARADGRGLSDARDLLAV